VCNLRDSCAFDPALQFARLMQFLITQSRMMVSAKSVRDKDLVIEFGVRQMAARRMRCLKCHEHTAH
jgi:hypothetical protein